MNPFDFLDPDNAKQQSAFAALSQLGPALIAAGQPYNPLMNPGARGQALLAGFGGAAQAQQNHLRNALMMQQAKKQQEREEQVAQAQARITASLGGQSDLAPRTNPQPGQARPINALMSDPRFVSDLMQTSRNPAQVLQMLMKEPEQETFGQPIQAVGPDNQPSFVQVGNRGTPRPVPGYAPPPKDPKDPTFRAAIGPDGKPTFASPTQIQGGGYSPVPPPGLDLEIPDGKGGTIKVSTSSAGNKPSSGMQPATVRDIEEKQLNTFDAMGRLSSIQQSFEPRFLQLGSRLGNAWANAKDFAGLKLQPGEEKELTDFTNFRRNAVDNVNKSIKDATGATMGVQEAERIMATAPNPGTGIFDGDGPTAFKAKLDSSIAALKTSYMRHAWAKKNGLDPLKSGIKLDDMENIVNGQAKRIEDEIRVKYPGIQPEQLRVERNRQLGDLFGVNM